VKLRISVRVGYFFVGHHRSGEPHPQVAIEVVNRSPFALTISQVGFQLRGSKKVLALIDPILPDGGRIPRRLEARSAFTAYFSVEDTKKLSSQDVTRAYANTDSGEVGYSSRRSLRKLLRSLASSGAVVVQGNNVDCNGLASRLARFALSRFANAVV
jgi:hypothetical protein